jgi:hypothetical protein
MAQVESSASSTTITEPPERDVEAQKGRAQQKASHWKLVIDQTHVTPEVLSWPYKGSGTEEDPYIVEYIENDRRNPMLFPMWKKWMITILVAFVSRIHPYLKHSTVGLVSFRHYVKSRSLNLTTRQVFAIYVADTDFRLS